MARVHGGSISGTKTIIANEMGCERARRTRGSIRGVCDTDVVSITSRERPEIASSWRRSVLSGVAPAGPRLDNDGVDFDPSSRLLRAAAPVLDRLAERLLGTRYNVILADRDGHIVYRWLADRRLETVLDSLGIRPGATSAEDVIGTNALGTALEIRRGIAINGDEHFIEPFKPFSCYGHPIVSPVTRRLEGVLDISCTTRDANPLLAPFLMRAVEDIELRLVDLAKSSERVLMAAFQAETRLRSRPVAALGDDVVLTNKAAVDLLAPGDYASMRLLAEGLEEAPEHRARVRLSSGVEVDVHLSRVAGASDGALFRFQPTGQQSRPAAPRSTNSASAEENATGQVLIHGSSGTGRSTEARRLLPDATFLDCADVTALGEQTWAASLQKALADDGPICVENVDLLPSALAPLLVAAVGTGRRIVMTSAPLRELQGLHLALASTVVDRRELVSLAERAAEIGTMAMRLVHELDPAANIRLIPSVIETLASRAWPGNLHELRAVMADVLKRRRTGDVTVQDLPKDYQAPVRTKRLAGRERAERAAILDALNANASNKARAAADLGISRTTLYARMRALKITI